MGEKKRRAAAGYVPPQGPSEVELREILVPCGLWYRLATAGAFAPDPKAPEDEAREAVAKLVPRLEELLRIACEEPLAHLDARRKRQIGDLIDRETVALWGEFCLGQQSLKVALVLYHFTLALIDAGIFEEVYEGTAIGDALALLFRCFEHGFEEERLDASAQKQAGRLLRVLQGRGLYLRAGAADEQAAA